MAIYPHEHEVLPSATHQGRRRILRIAFGALYGPFAWAYDWVSRTFFVGQWSLWQRAALPHLRGPRVLEIGMGTGDLQPAMRAAGLEPVGIDYSRQMLRQAGSKARRKSYSLLACRARAQALPFPSGSFDSVVSTFPSEYIADAATLAEAARVLRQGGRLVVIPGGWLVPKGARAAALEGVARLVYGYRAGPDGTNREDIARRAGEESGWRRGITALEKQMAAAGFRVSARIASNARGACLIVIAEKPEVGGFPRTSDLDQH